MGIWTSKEYVGQDGTGFQNSFAIINWFIPVKILRKHTHLNKINLIMITINIIQLINIYVLFLIFYKKISSNFFYNFFLT